MNLHLGKHTIASNLCFFIIISIIFLTEHLHPPVNRIHYSILFESVSTSLKEKNHRRLKKMEMMLTGANV